MALMGPNLWRSWSKEPMGVFGARPAVGGLYTNQYAGIGNGTIFQMTPAGTLATVINLDGTNGGAPWASLAKGPDGNLYGTARSGGSFTNFLGIRFGKFFKITPDGTFKRLMSFDGTNNGGSFFGLVPTADASPTWRIRPTA